MQKNEEEIVKTALRISQRAWAQLELHSHSRSDREVLSEYLKLCPYVKNNSPAMMAALKALEEHIDPKPDALVSQEEEEVENAPQSTTRSQPTPDPIPEAKETDDEKEDSSVDEKPPTAAFSPEPALPVTVKTYPLLRFLLLDIPLALTLLSVAAFEWVHHVHDHYLHPQYLDAFWTSSRRKKEITYYTRSCDESDMTTQTSADLFLSADATVEVAYEHQLLHGFTVFRKVLSEETASNLRDFVISRNHQLAPEESIFVIENENRYSFGLGTDEPSVAAAMEELASNERLAPALEEILGPNPALIELTAISVEYGAVPQYWHDDVVPSASALNYARSFGPSYSVFIPLQNTTQEMGATSGCPGTHYCTTGTMDIYCEEKGFQVVNENGFWGIGDALLMNMNSYHRGAGHTDPNAPARVMLILTFVPQPMDRVESRQMSQGITFSLRWDMWGHTLKDLANAGTMMSQPWATLRALGLYKRSGGEWGIDYISGSTMRMANEDNGFRREQLDEFLERGGFSFLPESLHGKVGNKDGWYEFYIRTFLLCKDALTRFTAAFAVLYLVFGSYAAFVNKKRRYWRSIVGVFFKLVVCSGLAWVLFIMAKEHVDNTGWAKDIQSHRRYTAFQSPVDDSAAQGRATFPTKFDVLIENLYGSRQLHMYNDFINWHPGNRYFRSLLEALKEPYFGYSELLQKRSLEYIVEAVQDNNGRFLTQAAEGAWHVISDDQASLYVAKHLSYLETEFKFQLALELKYARADVKFGLMSKTALALKHTEPVFQAIESKVSKRVDSKPAWDIVAKPRGCRLPLRINFRSPPSTRRQSSFPRKLPPVEPYPDAWITTGDVVEGLVDAMWYLGTVVHVTAQGFYKMHYPDGDRNVVDAFEIRWFQPYYAGERVEVLVEDDYLPCTVIARQGDFYTVVLTRSNQQVEGLRAELFRRHPGQLKKRHTYIPA